MAGAGRRGDGGPGWSLQRPCPGCGRHGDACRCRAASPGVDAGRPTLRMRLEKRSGKSVTVLAATHVPVPRLRALLPELKAMLATGGTVKDGALELQGDHRERLRAALAGREFAVKG